MLDSINVGTSGLLGYAKGLRVIANNTANLNTPGYKAATLQFSDLFYAASQGAGGGSARLGYGLATGATQLDFRQGDLRQTGNDFDLGVDGEGLFVLQTSDGATRYTRAGQFEFNQDGLFVNRGDGSKVMGIDANGQATDIKLDGLRSAPGKATALARFTGNLSSTVTSHTVSAVKVNDAIGEEHNLSLKFTSTDTATGAWSVEVLDGATSIATGQLQFDDGKPTAATSKLQFSYQPANREARELTLDFSSDVTSFASGNLSTLAMTAQDGLPPGNLVKVGFDAAGKLVATYSNGDTVKGARLQLARFRTLDAVQAEGGNQFVQANGLSWETGGAGEGAFGAVRAGVLEISNVDLSREFSDLVVLQRGYQASSQVLATANDMLQELFRMKAK
ncbi:flagellar hook-basal body complex protein [Ramlibacter sp. XY19]|uniref:flagellar hook-basal body complex protein n=1 Tax=Ramlibacter paludis TaxID=2908000 RepID=UPI0023DC68AE|nr:flagellar hook-basal body complex protein [Ramlibacter paludis]MCG2594957.1 flagellar hook-basal body complex protein [Ramlibacter paludis]